MASTILLIVPFPAGGHPFNAINIAFCLASPSLQVHILVPDLKRADTWIKSTVQPPNSNVHIRLLPDSELAEKALSWDPRVITQTIGGQAWSDAVGLTLDQLRKEHPASKVGEVVINPMMRATVESKAKLGVKIFAISPFALFVMRLSISEKNIRGVSLDEGLDMNGIGGLQKPLRFNYSDGVDLTTMMWHDFVKPGLYGCDGQLMSNTNAGIEGSERTDWAGDDYLIGPMLPEWFYKVVDEGYEQALKERPGNRKDNDTDGVLEYLDKQKDRSTVYVTLGTHSDFSTDQAKLIISILEEHKTPFIFLNHGFTTALREAVGQGLGGVITSWAPQLDVLCHPAIKFTITHSGFGTMVEGIVGGCMPFLACPIASDQFMDTKFMEHVGILLGTIGLNHQRTQLERKDPYPFMPEDGGKAVRELLGGLLNSREGEQKIQRAREAALALRQRIVEARATDVQKELQRFRDAISAST